MEAETNGSHFPDEIFKCIFLNENVWISIEISLKFVPKGLFNNIPALVQIMAWRRSGDKPLSETMMVSLLTHICVTRPQWVNRDSSFQNAQWFGDTTKNAQQRIKCHQFFRFFAYTPFTQGLRPLGLPCATTKLARSPLRAEGRPNGCRGRSRVAHRTFRHRHGRREVLSMFKTIAQRSLRRSVAHRSLKGGRMKAHTSPWSQNGCTVVGHWSPNKKCEHCVSIWATRLPSLYHHCASFGRPMVSIGRSLWRPLCLHSATTATLEPPWQWFCLHSAFFAWPVVPLQQLWSFKEGTRVVLQQLHRNITF